MAEYQEQTQAPLPYWTEAQNRLLGQGEQLYNQQRWGTVPTQGVAGLTPDQQRAFELARSSAGSWQPALDQSQQFLTQAGQGAQFDPNQVQQYLNPYLSGVIGEIGRLGQQGFQETVAPSIARQFGGLGQYGSARQAMALAEAGGRQQRETLGQQAGALKSAYDTAMQGYKDWTQMGIGAKQAAGIGLGNLGQQMQGLYTGDIANLSTAGATQQKQQQDILNSQYQQWQQQQQYPWQALNQWADLFKTGMPQTSTSWNTGFKKGGLARYADGGRFRDEEALERLLDEKGVDDPAVRSRVKALAMKESSGRLDAYGPEVPSGKHRGDRAFGMFQLMPKTAEELGGVDMSDPESATAGGLDYFLNNYNQFGDLDLATIAHHAGPGGAEKYRLSGDAGTRDLATGLATNDYLNEVKKLEKPVVASATPDSVPTVLDQQPSVQVAANDLTGVNLDLPRRAFDERMELLERVRGSPELKPMEEESWMSRAGEAMLRAAAESPENLGQFIGKSGTAYFDKEAAVNAENKRRALERLGLEERILPDVPRMLAGARAAGAGGAKTPTPEQIRTVYNTALNAAAQVAKEKGYTFKTAEQRAAWIRQEANKMTQGYVDRFATQPTGPRGAGEEPPPAVTPPAVAPPAATPSPAVTPPAEAATPPATAPTTEIVAGQKDLIEEERRKKATLGTEEAAMKEFNEKIAPDADVATEMSQSINVLRQIPRTQDRFAGWRMELGSWVDALGIDDGKLGSLAREAKNLQQVQPILHKIANDRLLLAKGVQTEGDAERAFREFTKITDTQQAADFMMAWSQELAERAKARRDMAQEGYKAAGTWTAGREIWQNSDYMKTPPVALINGRPWGFTEWRTQFGKMNPDATIHDAIEVWNGLTKEAAEKARR